MPAHQSWVASYPFPTIVSGSTSCTGHSKCRATQVSVESIKEYSGVNNYSTVYPHCLLFHLYFWNLYNTERSILMWLKPTRASSLCSTYAPQFQKVQNRSLFPVNEISSGYNVFCYFTVLKFGCSSTWIYPCKFLNQKPKPKMQHIWTFTLAWWVRLFCDTWSTAANAWWKKQTRDASILWAFCEDL